MKRSWYIFLAKVLVLAMLLTATYLFFARQLTQTFVSDDYAKFTHQSASLILGLSRAHYAFDPETITKQLEEVDYQGPFLNFAFEKSQSPYGEVYLNAILKKIPESTAKGIYIMGVSPGSFSASNRLRTPEDILEFDSGTMLGKMNNMNTHPNLEFVRKCFGRSLYKGIWPHDHRISTVFHDNGWEEFRLYAPGYRITQESIDHWQRETVSGYSKLADVIPEHVSDYRIEWFGKTMDSLQKRGLVYLVRVPMHEGVLALEDRVWSDFDKTIDSIAREKGVPYLNYRDRAYDFETYDGSHLHSESAKAFSKDVGTVIKNHIVQRELVQYSQEEY
ncbi:hypothetical protein E7Z59_06465 [Robertkochia marina]|uniref:Uncharacterized protein n=1 Tax=Robertkochia marina TaxID=1227945 RepID=A0A4S3M480_9FLAO|nr:hypothetical protein [Robertkochia marina]THD69966.1 hypothetical protein E7Z59_06465 [Robertkochia marina]TRZ46689.1 hypothetical protein D3A96_03735 [Robertkochia marina]